MVIKSVGRSLWDVMHSKGKVFRIGGDEFVGFSKAIDEDKLFQALDYLEGGSL